MSSEVSVPVAVAAAEPVVPRFEVHFLASGSAGNCTLVEDGHGRFVIDFGLAPQAFVGMLRERGVHLDYSRKRNEVWARRDRSAPPPLAGAVLTHTHSDHMQERTLRVLRENGIRLYVHEAHLGPLRLNRDFRDLQDDGNVTVFGADDFAVTPATTARPLDLPHDCAGTTGFVFRHDAGAGRRAKFTYLADLGHFRPELADEARDSDILALEFNHDLEMENASPRPRTLVNRVLGNHGHLSNDQAGQALRQIVARSRRPPRWLVALHLSSDCNRHHLAERSARAVLDELGADTRVMVARQKLFSGSVAVEPVAAAPQGACGLDARHDHGGVVAAATATSGRSGLGVQQVLNLEL